MIYEKKLFAIIKRENRARNASLMIKTYSSTRREKISKIYRKFGTYLDNMNFQYIFPEVEFN